MIVKGQRVNWVSQSGGSEKEKRGIVLEIIRSGESAMEYVPSEAKKSHIKFNNKSGICRALVAVPAGKDGMIVHYYCPAISVLEWQSKKQH